MYIPKYYMIQDEDSVYKIINQYGFGTLFSHHNGEPCATHLPLNLNKEEKTLYGHLARANEQWKDAVDQQVLAVFQGPHSYISPSWYETNQAVPTWNYVAVHVYGQLEIIKDQHTIFELLKNSVEKYEKPESTYQLKGVDANLVEGLSKGIVAFKIHITKMEAQAKLSQNHSVERRKRVIQHLEESGRIDSIQVAELMKSTLSLKK
ncbi:FMN-binding negative transcriptional regulator [Priestia flexa]|uniref:FMN-binding negative transcriptional regulator n=1 Tax=Priestia flexa TaxID=86664 RepID=UPI001B3310EB|nr:FMN-binding negative transcriptional regulator [Priestia flexa]